MAHQFAEVVAHFGRDLALECLAPSATLQRLACANSLWIDLDRSHIDFTPPDDAIDLSDEALRHCHRIVRRVALRGAQPILSRSIVEGFRRERWMPLAC